MLSSSGPTPPPANTSAPTVTAAAAKTDPSAAPGSANSGIGTAPGANRQPSKPAPSEAPGSMPVDNPADHKDVNCGPIDPAQKDSQNLLAESTPAGTVGCTEVFNVMDEYKKYPVDPQGGTMREAKLASGWTCAMVPHATMKSTTIVACNKGGLSFRSEPAK
ncbi:hypothetical protein ACFWY9_09075 [Amycolatopsis sp. NPDC059027]|uniref:hypothetical protein n=1 Tax=Amycolatopsis sp. NPDC059027 TaxID=3346709 RepID=UPI003671C27C